MNDIQDALDELAKNHHDDDGYEAVMSALVTIHANIEQVEDERDEAIERLAATAARDCSHRRCRPDRDCVLRHLDTTDELMEAVRSGSVGSRGPGDGDTPCAGRQGGKAMSDVQDALDNRQPPWMPALSRLSWAAAHYRYPDDDFTLDREDEPEASTIHAHIAKQDAVVEAARALLPCSQCNDYKNRERCKYGNSNPEHGLRPGPCGMWDLRASLDMFDSK